MSNLYDNFANKKYMLVVELNSIDSTVKHPYYDKCFDTREDAINYWNGMKNKPSRYTSYYRAKILEVNEVYHEVL